MKKYKVILISGGFDLYTKVISNVFRIKRTFKDEVWIGLNNDGWLRRKKGKSFMKEQERTLCNG